MLISLRLIYKPPVTVSLKEFTGSLQREASITAAFHTPPVIFIHQLDTTVCKLNPPDTSETS